MGLMRIVLLFGVRVLQKMITTLQKEMDAIKTSSEAARAAAGTLLETTD